jgi:outer membrane biosynthesis protein TonB
MASRAPTYDRKAFGLSLALHAAVFAVGWLSTFYEPEVVEFVTYEIELVSPSPAVQADVAELAAEEIVVERPEAREEPEPEPEPPPPQREDPRPRPEPAPRESEPQPEPQRPSPPAEEPRPTAEEARLATTTETPPEDARESGEGINVRLEGIRRDYPAYYDNIIRQIQRCFRWQGGGSWETTIYFAIRRDGTAADIEFVTRSGSSAFDFEAMGAIDCAGQGRFGPLPEDLPYDRLPIQFSFRPMGMER